MDEAETGPAPPKRRRSDHYVTFRDAFAGIVVALAVIGAFGAWVVGEAKGQSALVTAPVLLALDRFERSLDRLETKVDSLLLQKQPGPGD